MEKKCTFVSVWDDGTVVRFDCIYNPTTGEIVDEVPTLTPDKATLEREFIEVDGEEIAVCPVCHTFTMKPIVGDRNPLIAGGDFGEMKECRDPECDTD